MPGGPRKTTFSLAVTKSRVPRWAMTSRLRERWWSKSKSSSALAGREPGGADAALAAVGLAGGDLALQAGGEELLVGPGLGPGPLGQPVDRRRAASGPSTPGSGRPARPVDVRGRCSAAGRGGHHATSSLAMPNRRVVVGSGRRRLSTSTSAAAGGGR